MSSETLAEYVVAGVAASVRIPGSPQCILTIDSPSDVMNLDVSWDGEQPPDIDDYLHIYTGVAFRRGENWATVSVRGADYFGEAYPLLCSVADLVQVDGRTFADALTSSLRSYHDLLAAASGMSASDEIGLYGELLVLEHLIAAAGPADALQSWRGGDQREEHDLGLLEDDVEIKTTTSETRHHWIGSLGQLLPTSGRRLWLLSIQLTGAGLGDGRRLPDLIREVEEGLPPQLRGMFRVRLAGSGFHASQAPGRFRLLRLRTKPACYRVDDQFPHLTRPMLDQSGADLDRIDEVSYSVRLDTLKPAASPPAQLWHFVTEGSTR